MTYWDGSLPHAKVYEIQHLATGLRELMEEGHCTRKVVVNVAEDIQSAVTGLLEGLKNE